MTTTTCTCRRCGATWTPRVPDPVACPRCKSARWQTPAWAWLERFTYEDGAQPPRRIDGTIPDPRDGQLTDPLDDQYDTESERRDT